MLQKFTSLKSHFLGAFSRFLTKNALFLLFYKQKFFLLIKFIFYEKTMDVFYFSSVTFFLWK
jgi:hypothetical protein